MQNLSGEGRVWLDNYFKALKTYSASGGGDTAALETAAQSLEFLLQRSPENGPFIQRLSLQAAMISRHRGAPDITLRLAENGIAAGVAQDAKTRDASRFVNQILLLVAIEANLEDGQRIEGIQTLKKLAQSISENDSKQAIGRWILANRCYYSAELNDQILEYVSAFDFYSKAVEALKPLMQDKKMRDEFLKEWIDLCYGEEMKGGAALGEDLYAVPDLELKKLYANAWLGLVRSQKILKDANQQKSNALAAVEAIESAGIPPGIDPYTVIPLLSYLPEVKGNLHAKWILESGTQQILNFPGLQSLLDNPVTRELGEMMMKNLKTKQEKELVDWQVATRIGIASSLVKENKIKEAGSLAFEALQLAMDHPESIAATICSGFLTVMCQVYKSDQVEKYADYFEKSLGLAVINNKAIWNDTFYREIFEGPLSVVTEFKLEKFIQSGDPINSTNASILLNALKTGEAPDFSIILSSSEGIPSEGGYAGRGLEYASDSIGRIKDALSANALALIVIPIATGTGFLLLSKKWDKPKWEKAGKEYRLAVDGIQSSVELELKKMKIGEDPKAEALSGPGEQLFKSLPSAVCAAIQDHDEILIVPDYSSDGGIVPFELMSDNKLFLGTEKIISRFISLSHLAEALDSLQPRPHRARGIVTPITNPTMLEAERLKAAEQECKLISQLLSDAKYDLPQVDLTGLDPKFYTDRFSYIDVLHIAAHGESLEGEEWLLLPNETKFYTDDLFVRRQRSLPFVYLNTCHLGITRYLGAGINRGFAFGLVESGAPAVIANTIETLDQQTARLSIGFYRRSLSMPVGEALRETRKDLINKNVSPVIWGSAVLFGNPYHRLPVPDGKAEMKSTPDLSFEVLDAFLSNDPDKAKKWEEAVGSLNEGSYQPKLEASIMLLKGLEEYGTSDEASKDSILSKLIELADKLKHLPSQASLRVMEYKWLNSQKLSKDAYASVNELIPYLEALAPVYPEWQNELMQAQAAKKRLELEFEGRGPEVLGPTGGDDKALNALLDALYASQESNQALKGEVEMRDEEDESGIAWNAIIMGSGNKFESMPETIAFARQTCDKLIQKKVLKKSLQTEGSILISSMLKYLWSVQNLAYLDPDTAAGQSGTLLAFVQDINEKWPGSQKKPGYQKLQNFGSEIDKTLAHIQALPNEKDFADLEKNMTQVLGELQELNPEIFPLCSAYISGLLIAKNTFSYVDGSVPEDIQKKMEGLYYSASRDQESHFYPYLMKGYEGVRNREMTDVEKWIIEESATH